MSEPDRGSLTNIFYRQSLGWYHQRQNCMWAIKLCLEGRDQKIGDAANQGIYMHRLIEEFLTGVNDGAEIPLPIKLYIMSHKISPQHCELAMRVSLPDFEGGGTIDSITDSGIILDWKFPLSKWNSQKLADYSEIQAYFYIWLVREFRKTHPEVPEVTGFRYIVAWTDMKYGFNEQFNQVSVYDVPMDETLIQLAFRKARTRYLQYKSHQENNTWEANPSAWNCKFCNFRAHCDSAM